MKIILLSGGAGKRLWPLSSESRSKQFMKLSSDKSGRQLSMVQNTMRQLELAGLTDEILITTSSNQLQQLREQLGEHIRAAVEPERKDTFPAVMLGAAYLQSVLHVDAHETVLVLPVDHRADPSFYQMLFQLDNLVQSEEVALGLIGVKPSRPSSKFGYMIPTKERQTNPALPISRFVEKPDELTATELISQGAMWNCGVFAFKLSYMIEQIEKRGLVPHYDWFLENYSTLPKVSFDYAIVEHETRISALEYNGEWSDMGTWDSLTQTMEKPMYGIGLVDESSSNTHVVNELPIPIIVADLHDAVVIAGRDGILVTSRQASNDLKPLIERVTEEEKHTEGATDYGWIRTLDIHNAPKHSSAAHTRRIHMDAGKQLPCNNERTTTWIILSGEGIYQSGNDRLTLQPGQVIQPSSGSWLHTSLHDCELIEMTILDTKKEELR